MTNETPKLSFSAAMACGLVTTSQNPSAPDFVDSHMSAAIGQRHHDGEEQGHEAEREGRTRPLARCDPRDVPRRLSALDR